MATLKNDECMQKEIEYAFSNVKKFLLKRLDYGDEKYASWFIGNLRPDRHSAVTLRSLHGLPMNIQSVKATKDVDISKIEGLGIAELQKLLGINLSITQMSKMVTILRRTKLIKIQPYLIQAFRNSLNEMKVLFHNLLNIKKSSK